MMPGKSATFMPMGSRKPFDSRYGMSAESVSVVTSHTKFFVCTIAANCATGCESRATLTTLMPVAFSNGS